MIDHEPAALHERVAYLRPDEAEAELLERPRHLLRGLRVRRDLLRGCPRVQLRRAVHKAPEQRVQRAVLGVRVRVRVRVRIRVRVKG